MNNIIFLSYLDTKLFLGIDYDNYIYNLTKIDLYARKAKSNSDYLSMITDATADFTFFEMCKITYAINKTTDFLSKNDYLENINNIQWKIAKTNGLVYENGMPHTRSDIIFLTDVILKNISIKVL
jgi:hypothetical protein